MNYKYILIIAALMVQQVYCVKNSNRLATTIYLMSPELNNFVQSMVKLLTSEEIKKAIGFDFNGSQYPNEICFKDKNNNLKFVKFNPDEYEIVKIMSDEDCSLCTQKINQMIAKK